MTLPMVFASLYAGILTSIFIGLCWLFFFEDEGADEIDEESRYAREWDTEESEARCLPVDDDDGEDGEREGEGDEEPCAYLAHCRDVVCLIK